MVREGYLWNYIYQDSDSITQSELMRMMNDNSKDEEIQAGNYSSYTVYLQSLCTDQGMHKTCGRVCELK